MDATLARSGRRELRGGTIRVAPAGPPIVVRDEALTIGRHASCGLVLDDPRVSSVHLELTATSDGTRLRDLGSTNGVFVGGARIGEALLVATTRISIGDSSLVFEPGAPEAVADAPLEGFGALVGRSPAMQRVFRTIARAAPTDLTVLLLGETGTGKELAARAIHDASRRKAGPFVVVDCGSIPATLAEAHLFGHERGAFTGAVSRRESPFVEASGGTLFLDELGELPIELQPKLLRALAERRVQAVGGTKYRAVDVRILAATRRDLVREVNEGTFRSDLYFRVAELRMEIPPLRDRLEDIPLLVRHMLAALGDPGAYARVPTATLERLMTHPWPGNVRELRSAVTVAHAFSGDGDVDVSPQTGDARASGLELVASASTGYHDAKRAVLDRFEREYFTALWKAAGGRIGQVATLAGIERAHVRRYLRAHGITAPPSKKKA